MGPHTRHTSRFGVYNNNNHRRLVDFTRRPVFPNTTVKKQNWELEGGSNLQHAAGMAQKMGRWRRLCERPHYGSSKPDQNNLRLLYAKMQGWHSRPYRRFVLIQANGQACSIFEWTEDYHKKTVLHLKKFFTTCMMQSMLVSDQNSSLLITDLWYGLVSALQILKNIRIG